jgi:hypothetical protein
VNKFLETEEHQNRCIQAERRKPLGRPRRRRKDNIKMNLREVEWGMEWIFLAKNRKSWRSVVNAVMNFQVPQNPGNFFSSLESVSFSRRTLFHKVS